MTLDYTYNYNDAEQAKKVLSSIQDQFNDYVHELVPNTRIEIIENLKLNHIYIFIICTVIS